MVFCSELPVHSKTHWHWSPVESTSKSSTCNEGMVTLGHRLVLHRCLWSRQTRQPFLVKVTVMFRFLSDGLITSRLLIAENKCFGSIQFSYIPTVVDRNTTKFTRGPNRVGIFMESWSWSHLPNCYHTCAESAFLSIHINKLIQTDINQQ